MIEIHIDDREVRQALSDLARRVADMTPAMHDIGQALVEGVRARIRDGADWQGRAFAPNRPTTLAKKRGSKPLIDRGNLAGQRLHYAAGRDHVEAGSSAVQSAVLHFGAKKASLAAPGAARPSLGATSRRDLSCRSKAATDCRRRPAAPLPRSSPIIWPTPGADRKTRLKAAGAVFCPGGYYPLSRPEKIDSNPPL